MATPRSLSLLFFLCICFSLILTFLPVLSKAHLLDAIALPRESCVCVTPDLLVAMLSQQGFALLREGVRV